MWKYVFTCVVIKVKTFHSCRVIAVRVALVSHFCRSCSTHVALVLHSCRWCLPLVLWNRLDLINLVNFGLWNYLFSTRMNLLKQVLIWFKILYNSLKWCLDGNAQPSLTRYRPYEIIPILYAELNTPSLLLSFHLASNCKNSNGHLRIPFSETIKFDPHFTIPN